LKSIPASVRVQFYCFVQPRSGRTEDKFQYPPTLISELAGICCLPALQSAEFTHQWSEASCNKSLTSIPAMITDSDGLPLCRPVGVAAGFNGDDEIDLSLSQSYWAEELFSRAFVCIKLDNLKQEGTLVFRHRQKNNQPEA